MLQCGICARRTTHDSLTQVKVKVDVTVQQSRGSTASYCSHSVCDGRRADPVEIVF